MTGNYMNAPSDRVAYDRDGSVMSVLVSDGSVSNLPSSAMRLLNSESGASYSVPSGTGSLAVCFPIPMDIAAVFLAMTSVYDLLVQTSKDTTNGMDGTWSNQTNGNIATSVAPQYRILSELKMMVPGALSTQVRGVRVQRNNSPTSGLSSLQFRAFHIYATPSSTATDERLAFWHPTLDEKTSPIYFDWGDVPRGSSEDRSFRIKNLSDSRRALDTSVFLEALTTSTPPVQGMFLLSGNGGATFVPSLTLPVLEPGQVSPVLIVRRTVPTNASVSVWTVRIVADVTTWQEV